MAEERYPHRPADLTLNATLSDDCLHPTPRFLLPIRPSLHPRARSGGTRMKSPESNRPSFPLASLGLVPLSPPLILQFRSSFFFLQPILPPTFSSISYLLLLQFLLIYLLLLGGRLFRSHCFASSNQIVAYFDAAEFKRRNIDLDGQKKVGMKNRVMMMGSYGLRLKCAKDGSRPESV